MGLSSATNKERVEFSFEEGKRELIIFFAWALRVEDARG
jgi:hypothetical protein